MREGYTLCVYYGNCTNRRRTGGFSSMMHRRHSIELVPVDITDDTVTEVAGHLSRGARLGGTNLASLQHWLLIFGATIGELYLTVADFAEWLANGRPT